jgi:hypothetical protein
MKGQINFLRDIVAPAGKGDLDRVREIIGQDPGWLKVVGSHGRTMLWEAAYRGRAEVVRFLTEHGADINLPGCHYTPHGIEISPQCVAKLKRRPEIVDFLEQSGALVGVHSHAYLGDLDALRQHLETDPAHLESGSLQVDWHADGTSVHRLCNWATPLAHAIAGMQLDTIRFLIDRGALVHKEMQAIVNLRSKKLPAIRPLYDSFAGTTTPDTDLAGYGNWPPLVYLCRGDRGGNVDEIQKLLARGVDIEQRNHKAQTALHVTARAGLVAAVNCLLDNKADPNALDADLQTPLHAAVRTSIRRLERSREVISLLLANGADASLQDKKGRSVVAAAQATRRQDREQLLALLT